MIRNQFILELTPLRHRTYLGQREQVPHPGPLEKAPSSGPHSLRVQGLSLSCRSSPKRRCPFVFLSMAWAD